MNTYRPDANWWRSSFCGASAGCLEASRAGRLVLVRDSKTAASTGLIQQWTADEWVDLLSAVKLDVDHVGIDPVDGGVWFGLHRHEKLRFTDNEWAAFVGGVIEDEFRYATLPSYASTLSGPTSSEGCDAGQPVGVGGGSDQIAATGAGAIAVPPVPVAARVRATAIRGALYDSLSPNFEIDSDGYDDAAVAVAKLIEPVPVAAQPRYVLDAAAIVDMVKRYGEAIHLAAVWPDRQSARTEAEDLFVAIRGALTPIPTVEPEPRWGAGPLVEHVPETPSADPYTHAAMVTQHPVGCGCTSCADIRRSVAGTGSADLSVCCEVGRATAGKQHEAACFGDLL